MVANVTLDKAQELADEIADFDMVGAVVFDETPAHYASSSARISVSFRGVEDDPKVVEEQEHIREFLEPYDTYIYAVTWQAYFAQLAHEMIGIVLIAVLVIIAILLFTSRSYFEVVIFFLVFVFAAVLNMGTNFWLGEISTITNSEPSSKIASPLLPAFHFCTKFTAMPVFRCSTPSTIEPYSAMVLSVSGLNRRQRPGQVLSGLIRWTS